MQAKQCPKCNLESHDGSMVCSFCGTPPITIQDAQWHAMVGKASLLFRLVLCISVATSALMLLLDSTASYQFIGLSLFWLYFDRYFHNRFRGKPAFFSGSETVYPHDTGKRKRSIDIAVLFMSFFNFVFSLAVLLNSFQK
jgi:hypothetical protein